MKLGYKRKETNSLLNIMFVESNLFKLSSNYEGYYWLISFYSFSALIYIENDRNLMNTSYKIFGNPNLHK